MRVPFWFIGILLLKLSGFPLLGKKINALRLKQSLLNQQEHEQMFQGRKKLIEITIF